MLEQGSTWVTPIMAIQSTPRSQDVDVELGRNLAKVKMAPPKGSQAGREWIGAKRSYVKTTCNDREGCGRPLSRYVPMALPSDCALSRSGLPSGSAGSEADLMIANA